MFCSRRLLATFVIFVRVAISQVSVYPQKCVKEDSGLLGVIEVLGSASSLQECAGYCLNNRPPAAPSTPTWKCGSFMYQAAKKACALNSGSTADSPWATDPSFKGIQLGDAACPSDAVTTSTRQSITSAGLTSAAPSRSTAVSEASTNSAGGSTGLSQCCQWALNGECDLNLFWMRPNCQEACGTTGCTYGTALSCQVKISESCSPASTPTSTATNIPSCLDGHNRCPQWARDGECVKNQFWMMPNCQKSCGSCGTEIQNINNALKDSNCLSKDKYTFCGFWASRGCSNNVWLQQNCPASCRTCP